MLRMSRFSKTRLPDSLLSPTATSAMARPWPATQIFDLTVPTTEVTNGGEVRLEDQR